MPKKNMLFIANLQAGQKKLNRKLGDILSIFGRYDFLPTVVPTLKGGHAREIARDLAAGYDLIVCAGGDGTLSETVSGLLESGASVPIGYIPCGTTNDFASTLGLSKDMDTAALDIVLGNSMSIDVGCFNGRNFIYTVSFGAFTRASYATPQSMKNTLGHLAYVLEGIVDLANLQSINLSIKTESEEFSGNFVFGAISNSTSLAGILTLDKERVLLDDGKFELLLMDSPKNVLELSQLLINLSQKKYEPPIRLISASSIEIETDGSVDWTLDGEFQKGASKIRITNLPSAVKIIIPPNRKTEKLTEIM